MVGKNWGSQAYIFPQVNFSLPQTVFQHRAGGEIQCTWSYGHVSSTVLMEGWKNNKMVIGWYTMCITYGGLILFPRFFVKKHQYMTTTSSCCVNSKNDYNKDEDQNNDDDDDGRAASLHRIPQVDAWCRRACNPLLLSWSLFWCLILCTKLFWANFGQKRAPRSLPSNMSNTKTCLFGVSLWW